MYLLTGTVTTDFKQVAVSIALELEMFGSGIGMKEILHTILSISSEHTPSRQGL